MQCRVSVGISVRAMSPPRNSFRKLICLFIGGEGCLSGQGCWKMLHLHTQGLQGAWGSVKQGLTSDNCQGNKFIVGLMVEQLDSWHPFERREVAKFWHLMYLGLKLLWLFLSNPGPLCSQSYLSKFTVPNTHLSKLTVLITHLSACG